MSTRESKKFRLSTRESLYKSQNGLCAYCKRVIKGKPSVDHIIPVSLMDENKCNPDNYVVTCIGCNKRKGDNIIFSNLIDREIYPVIDIPYFF